MDNEWPEYIWIVQRPGHNDKQVETDADRVKYLESVGYEAAKYTILVPKGKWPSKAEEVSK